MRRIPTGVFLLAIAFFVFFGGAKHPLGDVDRSGEDRYDAVGGFEIRVGPFAAASALVRVARPRLSRVAGRRRERARDGAS